MMRPSYRANLAGDRRRQPFFGFIFDPRGEGQADPVDLRGGARAPGDSSDGRRSSTSAATRPRTRRPNKVIDTKISTPLFHLPLGTIASGDAADITSATQHASSPHLVGTGRTDYRRGASDRAASPGAVAELAAIRCRLRTEHSALVLRAEGGRARGRLAIDWCGSPAGGRSVSQPSHAGRRVRPLADGGGGPICRVVLRGPSRWWTC